MSSRRPESRLEDSGSYDNNYRPFPLQHPGDRDGAMYDDRYSRSNSRHRRRQSSSPPRRYASPHDRHRTSRNGNGASTQENFRSRDWSPRYNRDLARSYENHPRRQSPSPRDINRGARRDREVEVYRSPAYNSSSRSQSPHRARSPYFGGPPSKEVILEGLPLDMVEDDVCHHLPITEFSISKELKQYHNIEMLDDVRVIRDRQTKVSRGFGFIRFPDQEKSMAFIERNYPTIYLYGNGSTHSDEQAAKVRIAFSRERDDRNRGDRADGEWTCKICTFINFPGRTRCHRCQNPQSTMSLTATVKLPEYLNSGDSDASPNGTPSQFLLIRGLEPTVTEDLLAKGVAKLYKPTRRSTPPYPSGSKKINAKVASTTGDSNLGAKEGSLRRVLLVRDRHNNETWRYGFAEFGSVEDAQAALVRFNSFEKFTISSKPVTADYIHAGVFVPVFNFSEDVEKFTFSPLGNGATKLMYWDEQAWVSELAVSPVTPKEPVSSAENQVRSASDRAAAAAENEGLLKETEAKPKKRKVEVSEMTKQKKTAPAHLQFWSNRHAELHGVKPETLAEKSSKSNDGPESKKVSESSSREERTSTQSYADLSKKCCYLCSRKFKTDAEVNKHERLSQLHRDNLRNEELVLKAQEKMVKGGIPTTSQGESQEYRDRAKERRAAFGVSGKKMSLPLKKPLSQLSDEQESRDEYSTQAVSKGASLLGKMGWSAGKGLGAQGTGVTAPIATEMYVQGVGLGAQGGKIGDALEEAERNTKGGYHGFLERTKDKAKERFGQMA